MNNVFVFDTNSLISAALISGSVNKKAFLKAINLGIIAISNQTLAEFVEVLFREKFDSCFKNEDDRWEIIDEIYFSENECHYIRSPLSFSLCPLWFIQSYCPGTRQGCPYITSNSNKRSLFL